MAVKSILVSVQSKCIYSKNFNGGPFSSADLFGSFLSAINSIAQELTQDQLKTIILGKTKIYYELINKELNIYIILFTKRDAEDSKIKNFVEDIKDTFLETYSIEKIRVHGSEVHFFANFDVPLNIVLFKHDNILIPDFI